MTREDIIRMAQEAGLYHFYDSEGQCTGITNARLVTEDKERNDDRLVEMLAPFAALVAAAEREDLLNTIDALYDAEQGRHPMFSEGYNHALLHIEESVKARK